MNAAGSCSAHNRSRAEQRFSPASTFKIANALIGLSLGAVRSVEEVIPYTGDANPFMREWLQPMGLRGAMKVSNVPLYQELARRIGLQRREDAIGRLHYGNEQIGSDVTTFWLRGPLAISAVEQTRFLSPWPTEAPLPRRAQQQVAEITQAGIGPGWSLHAKTGWRMPRAPGWAGGWAGRGRETRSHPLPSTSPWPALPIPRNASSWGGAACRPWGSCQHRQGGLSLRHEAPFMKCHCPP